MTPFIEYPKFTYLGSEDPDDTKGTATWTILTSSDQPPDTVTVSNISFKEANAIDALIKHTADFTFAQSTHLANRVIQRDLSKLIDGRFLSGS